jgi:hypothetical protein
MRIYARRGRRGVSAGPLASLAVAAVVVMLACALATAWAYLLVPGIATVIGVNVWTRRTAQRMRQRG